MIHYILQIIGFQLLFLVVYEVFLKKETFFTWNRIYLLVTPLLSFVLPFVKIPVLQQSIPDTYRIELPEILLGNTNQGLPVNGGLLPEVVVTGDAPLDLFQVLLYVWYVGIAISLIVFTFKLYRIWKLERSGSKTYIDGIRVITIPNSTVAFSFFNTMFLGENLSQKQQSSIVLHEAIHMQEKHSLDMIFFEMQRILFWFNPLVYAYQKNMVLLQEYMADAKVVAQLDKRSYYQNLLEQVFQTENISFINTFFNHSFIKKRIIMLQKSKSKNLARLKYVLLIPVMCSMLFYVACSSKSKVVQEKSTVHDMSNKGESSKTDIEKVPLSELENIPFAVIDKVPTYPGCEGNEEGLKKCMSNKISKYVAQNYNVNIAKELGLTEVNKVFVAFRIDKKGNVTNVRARAPHPRLEEEARRVMQSLPRMKPGEQDGRPVGVLYSLPITFQIKA